MSVRTDTVNLNVNVNGNKAQNDLNNLRKKAADVKFEMEGLKKGTAEYIAKKKELAGITDEMNKLKKAIGITALTQKELVRELNTMKALKSSMQPFTEEWKKLDKEIKKVEGRLYDVKNGVQGFSSFFSKIKDEVKQFGLVAASYLGFQFITGQFTNIIRGAGKLSDSLADIQRVTGLTAEEVDNLNKSLKNLDTRTSTQGLRDIVVIAGKLGVAKDELVGFTEAVDQLVVALGDELGDADQITTQLGKILNVFDGGINADNISKLGNAIVDLANKGVATGGFIVDFTQRLAGLAGTANLALDASIGLAAGLEETGQRTESSSTAVIGLLGLLGKNTREFAKVAGKDVNEFARTIQDKPVEALLQLAEAVVKNKAGLTELAPAFKEIGVDGVRVQTVLGVIGSKADFFRQKIAEAGVALQGTSEISEAFALKNETFGATLDKLTKRFESFISSPAVTGFAKNLIAGFEVLLDLLQALPQYISRNVTAFSLLTLALALNNLARTKSILLFPLQILGLKNLTLAAVNLRTAKLALSVATNLLTLNFARALVQWRLLAVALKVNPFGLLLGTIGAVLLLFDVFKKKAKDVSDALSNMNTQQRLNTELQKTADESIRGTLATIEEQRRVLTGATASLGAKQKALQKLIAINPDFINTLKLSKDGHLEGAAAIDEYIKKLNEKAFAEAIVSKKKQLFEQVVEQQQIIDSNQLTAEQQKAVGGSLTFDRTPSGAFVAKAKAPIEDVRKFSAQTAARNTITDINREIAALDEMQKKYTDITVVKEELSTIPIIAGDPDNKEAEKLQSEIDNFKKEVERLRRDLEINGMEADEQEVARIEDKYKELLDRAEKYDFKNVSKNSLKKTPPKNTKKACRPAMIILISSAGKHSPAMHRVPSQKSNTSRS
jgi:TP901 family phage tail tape measure protein